MKGLSRYFGILFSVLLGITGCATKPEKRGSEAEVLTLKRKDPRFASSAAEGYWQTSVTRNSSGTALYVNRKSNIDVFTTNGLVRTIQKNVPTVFLGDADDVVAWEKDGDYFFKNGAVFPRPRPGWKEIEHLFLRSEKGRYFLKDGTVTDSREFPSPGSLSVTYDGRFCAYAVRDRVSIFQMEDTTNRLVFTQTNLLRGRPTLFSSHGRLYLFGREYPGSSQPALQCLFFSSKESNCVLDKQITLAGVHAVVDMDFSSERVIAVRSRDIIEPVVYVYDLSTQQRKRIGTGLRALFVRKELKDKMISK